MRRFIPLSLGLLLLLSSSLLAAIIHVPQDKPTIQAGINAAVNGDTVLVSPGTYFENVNFNGRNIVLKSVAGPEITILRGGGPIIKLVSGEDTTATIDGFSFKLGWATNGGGILFNNSSGAVINNIFDSCSAIGGSSGNGGAIACMGALSRVRIFNNVIKNGLGGGERGQADAIFCLGSTVEILRNLITDNSSVAVIFAYTNSNVKLTNNTIANTPGNTGAYAFLCQEAAAVEVRNNIFFNNTEAGIINFVGPSVKVEYNDFYLSPTYTNLGPGNITQNPIFVDGAPYSYELQPSSPCIDAGDPSSPLPSFGGTRVDMGAFEFLKPFSIITPRGNIPLRKPQFVWSRLQDSTGIVSASYRVVWAPNCDFMAADSSPVLSDTVWKIPYLLNTDQNYCWKAIAIPDVGDSVITDSVFFRVTKPTLVQVLPANNAALKIRRPTFIWKSVTDTSIPETFNYRVALSEDITFSTAETSAVLIDTLWKMDKNLIVSQTYFWNVVAAGDNGDTVISGTEKFSITGSIVQLLPIDTSILRIRRPTFIWQSVRDTSIHGTFTYYVILSKKTSFSPTEISPPLPDTVWKVDHTLNDNQTYFWKVIAVFDSSDTVFSNVSRFTITPLLSRLFLPTSTNRARQPTFIWQTARDTSVMDSFTYRVILSKAGDFAQAETSAVLPDTVWKASHKLNLSIAYYWKVEGLSDSGGSVFSNVRSFTILPPVLVPRVPLENANVRERQPTLVWNSVRDTSISDTFTYRVRVAKDGDFQHAIESPALADTSWQISGPLVVGGIYFWKVLAFYSGAGDTVQPSSIIFFREQPPRIIIPDDLSKIQAGIEAALNGDTVWVKPGTYYENVFFKGKRIRVISEGGPEVTTIAKYVDGLQLVNFSSSEDSTTLLSGFTLSGANQVANGAAIKIAGASPRIENNYIIGNSGDAGAIWVENGAPIIRRTLITKDTGQTAVLFSGAGGGELVNCTITDNNGDGIQVDAGLSIRITNSVVSFNTGYGMRSLNGSNTISTITYDDVFGNRSGHFFAILPSTGIINTDPLFVGDNPYSYHLSGLSPCIDAGDPAFAVPPGGGSRIDIGAFEFAQRRGDLNGDGIFTAADAVLELNCVFSAPGNCLATIADLNCDGSLSPTDVVLMLNAVFAAVPLPC